MTRKLASIQKILSIEPIENADNLEKATVLGWHCVVKKDDFSPGELCVFFEIDSFLPMIPQFDFLKPKGTSKLEDGTEGYRIRTVKIRGEISQGLICKLTEFPELKNFVEGDDVTDILGVKHWYPIVPANMKGLIKGSFPSFISRTDEPRVQLIQNILTKYKRQKCYITEKIDGTSVTYYIKDGKFGVCSRNMELQESEKNIYWSIAREKDIENKLKSYGANIAIQGEIYGPGIQRNPLMVEKPSVRFFNVFDIDKFKYFNGNEAFQFIHDIHLDFVPIIDGNYILHDDIDKIIQESSGKSMINREKDREGIVIRLSEEVIDKEMAKINGNGRISFKAINPLYLLKYE